MTPERKLLQGAVCPGAQTGTGVSLPVVVPSPSSPSKLRPQAATEPSDFSAKL